MSEVAGRMANSSRLVFYKKDMGGKEIILLGGVPGVQSGRKLTILGGRCWHECIENGYGQELKVTILDVDMEKLAFFGWFMFWQDGLGNQENVAKAVQLRILVVGSVLKGAGSKLITEND